jgi:hypothetical protein
MILITLVQNSRATVSHQVKLEWENASDAANEFQISAVTTILKWLKKEVDENGISTSPLSCSKTKSPNKNKLHLFRVRGNSLFINTQHDKHIVRVYLF